MISLVARDTRTQRAEKRKGEAWAEPYRLPGRERVGYWISRGREKEKKKSLVETSKEESKGKRADQQGGEGRRKECLPACQTMLPLLSCSQLFCLRGGQVCSNVDLCKKKNKNRKKENGQVYPGDR